MLHSRRARWSLTASTALLGPFLGVGVVFAAGPAPVPAQTDAPAPVPAAPDQSAAAAGNQIGDIVVTARRKEESSQVVPLALTALSQGLLQQNAVLNVRDLQTSTPGLLITTNQAGGDPTFAIRGAEQADGTNAGVSVYIDEVPVISTISVANMVYDMQSITTLKGPQGTLFGNNSTGGAVIFRPNKPTDLLEGYAMVGYGNYNRREAQGMINVPISDTLQIRVAGEIVRRDGFDTNISPLALPQDKKLGNDSHESVRFSARLKLSPTLVNDTVVDYYHQNQTPTTQQVVAYRSRFDYQTFVGVTVPVDYALHGIHTLQPFQVQTNGEPFYSIAGIVGVANTTNWDASADWHLKLALGYRHDLTDNSQSQDSSLQYSTSYGRVKFTNSQFTAEPSSTVTWGGGMWSNKTGVFFLRSSQTQNFEYNVLAEPFDFSGLTAAEVGAVNAFYPLQSILDDTVHHTSIAAYDQLSVKPTDTLTVTAGLRYTRDHESLVESDRNGFPSTGLAPYGDFYGGQCSAATAAYQNYNAANCTGTRSFTTNAPSYTLTIEDRFARNKMVYATFDGSYLVGGFNHQVTAPSGQIFGKESVNSFEMGVKADWDIGGQPLRTNIDFFYGNYSGQQRSTALISPQGNDYIAVENAGSTRFYGTDVDLTFKPTDFLTVTASDAFIISTYTNYTATLADPNVTAALDVAGAQEAQTPKNVITASAKLDLPIPKSMGALSTTLSFFHRSNALGSDSPSVGGTCANGSTVCTAPGTFVPDPALNFTQYDRLPGFSLFNLTVQWNAIGGSHFDAEFFVKNLANKLYYTALSNQLLTLGFATYELGDPRTFGGRIRFNF